MAVTFIKLSAHKNILVWLGFCFILTSILLTSLNLLRSQTKLSNFEKSRERISSYTLEKASYNGKGDFFTFFINEAYKYPGDFQANHSSQLIPWLDEKLVNRSVSFYNRNFFGISLAIIYSSVELFSIKSTTSVLMAAGTVDSRRKSIERILRTIVIMQSWGNVGMDIFNPNSSAYKYMQIVLKKHQLAPCTPMSNRSADAVDFMDKHVLEPSPDWKQLQELVEALKEDLKFVDTSEAPSHLLNWDTSTSVGQFDLGVVQFLIISHVVMTPKAFGIYKESPEDILAHIHAISVTGRILGLQDRFNVALNLPLEMYNRFYRNIVIASLKNVDQSNLHVMSLTMEAMSKEFLVPQFLRLKCWLYHSLKSSVDGFEGKYIYGTMNWEDKVCIKMLDFAMSSLNQNIIYKFVEQKTFKMWLKRTLKRHGIIYPD